MIVFSFFVVTICCAVCESVHIVPAVCSFLGPRVNYHNRQVNAERVKIVLLHMENLGDLSLSKACSLPLDNSRGVVESYDKLRNPALHNVDFMTTLTSLQNASVNRQSISDDVVRSIVAYVAGIRDSYGCISAMHSLNMLKFEATDFDFLFLDKFQSICELTLVRSPKAVFRVLGTLQLLKYDKLTSGLISAVNKALSIVFKDPTTRCDIVLKSLGHSGFTWSSLSDETRVALQHAMNREILQMNAVQFDKLLFSLNLLRAKYFELPIVRDGIVAHCYNCIESIDSAKLLDNLGQIEFPWTSLSLQVQKKLEPLLIDFLRSDCQNYTLHLFARLNFRLTDESELLKEFIKVELSKYLDKLTPDRFSIVFKKLTDIKIKWSMFNAESQQQLLNTINRLLPQMSDESNCYFTMQSVVMMQPPYEKLSEDLKDRVLHYVPEVLATATTNGFSATIDSLGKMGFKYASLSEDTKKLLHTKLLTHLTAADYTGVEIIIDGLNGMGVTSSDLSEELKQCIGSLLGKHKTNLNNLPSKYKSTLEDSLRSMFMTNTQ